MARKKSSSRKTIRGSSSGVSRKQAEDDVKRLTRQHRQTSNIMRKLFGKSKLFGK